ncbi:HEPN domain-containing protein [Streptomyces sp. A244]|uniref:HEPN domain-containing protein n=1 Tax=Streptomyces sp. A244 TaxID=2137016 RepID=UPI0011B2269E|nr:HEPN domain-containing protein [Streptomyces sp. A244]
MTMKDETLWSLAKPAIADALQKISNHLQSGKKIDNHSALPTLKETPEGNFRQFGTDYKTADFRKIFGPAGKFRLSPHTYEEIEGYDELLAYVSSIPAYAAFHGWSGGESNDLGRRMLEVGTADLIAEIAARHAHLRGFEFDEEYTRSRYLEMEAWWQSESLPVTLVVPLINISFEDDAVHISENISIERISDSDHLARVAGLVAYQRDEWAIRACTHAVLIRNEVTVNWPQSMGSEQWAGNFPYAKLDQVIQAVSVASMQPTGYYQVAYLPEGWSPGYVGQLALTRHAFKVDRKSQKLDTSSEAPSDVLDSEKANDIALLFDALQGANDQTTLAARRLQLASLREDELDEIVDLCVGIEALLGGTQAGETTYKLAVRGAAVLARKGFRDSAKVADLIKKVYAYRSYIVHGQAKHAKKRLVAMDGQKYLATGIAEIILIALLDVMLKNPTLIEHIDNDRVIFDLIDEWTAASTSSDDPSSSAS